MRSWTKIERLKSWTDVLYDAICLYTVYSGGARGRGLEAFAGIYEIRHRTEEVEKLYAYL